MQLKRKAERMPRKVAKPLIPAGLSAALRAIGPSIVTMDAVASCCACRSCQEKIDRVIAQVRHVTGLVV